MSSSLTQLVTVFNGTGYNAWADKMMAYLDFQGLSMIVLGDLKVPTLLSPVTPATAAHTALMEAKQEKFEQWTMKDRQA